MKSRSWLTPAQTAEELEVSRQAVHNWIKKGLLPARRVGSRWRIERSDLSRVVQEAAHE